MKNKTCTINLNIVLFVIASIHLTRICNILDSDRKEFTSERFAPGDEATGWHAASRFWWQNPWNLLIYLKYHSVPYEYTEVGSSLYLNCEGACLFRRSAGLAL
jgi:hypothetical protein